MGPHSLSQERGEPRERPEAPTGPVTVSARAGRVKPAGDIMYVVQYWVAGGGSGPRTTLVEAITADAACAEVRARGGLNVSARAPYSEREADLMRELGLDLESVVRTTRVHGPA